MTSTSSTATSVTDPVLELRDVEVHYGRRRRSVPVRAVNGVSLSLSPGETLGLVGESGCGKTSLTRAILGTTPLAAGSVRLRGVPISGLSRRAMRVHRPILQVVFQDPFSSLDPRMTVHDLIAEPLRINGRPTSPKVDELLRAVGLPESAGRRLPASFSGGQRQRIGIARALALEPDVVLLDEPVSALDVSIQAQVIELLKALQADRGLSYLFVSHDLGVIRHMSHKVAVMYLGKIVEYGTREEIFASARHPYTTTLLSAIPVPDPVGREERLGRAIVEGELPDPANPPTGCVFRTRCPRARPLCAERMPDPDELQASPTHRVACFFPEPEQPAGVSPDAVPLASSTPSSSAGWAARVPDPRQ